MPADHGYFANLIWQIADLLRGPYRPPQYERVMLPMTVLRRFDCVLAPTKARVLAEYERRRGGRFTGEALDSLLNRAAGQRFHNRSPLDFEKLKGDPDHIAHHLVSYIQGFSADVRRIFVEYFEFEAEIEKMRESHILYMIVSRFRSVDLHPDRVPNEQMGLIFENLIRRFNELANETAGDHFTPREVIRLMVSLLFIDDDALLATPGVVRKLLDPACGTGGMLAEAQGWLRDHHREARLYVYGQDYNKRAYATAASDMLMKQVDHNGGGSGSRSGGGDNVRLGDSLIGDRFAGDTFDYFLTNPPFGVDWKRQQGEVRREHEQSWLRGPLRSRAAEGERRLAPLPPAHDRQVRAGAPAGAPARLAARHRVLRLPAVHRRRGLGREQHPALDHRERLARSRHRPARADVLQHRDRHLRLDRHQPQGGAPAGPGPAPRRARPLDPRRQRGEPAQPRRQAPASRGRADRRDRAPLRPLRGRRALEGLRERRLRLHPRHRGTAAAAPLPDDVRRQGPLPQRLPVPAGRRPGHRPGARPRADARLERGVGAHRGPAAPRGSRWKKAEQRLFRDVFTHKDPDAEPVAKGGREQGFEPDSDLRDFEKIPLAEDVDDWFEREVRPHVPDAWMDRSKDRVGYEINFNRHFYEYTPPRPLEEIDAALKKAEAEITRLLREVVG